MIYNILESWSNNLHSYPTEIDREYQNDYTYTLVSDKVYDFLGYKVSSRIGIAAGPLLNSNWVNYASGLNSFSVLTYKTIQSQETKGHQVPNIVYITDDLSISENPTKTITNSFGMPSMSVSYLEEDIPKAMATLKQNQILVISITGKSIENLIKTATIAKNAKVPILEINLSCPNVSNIYGEAYLDPEMMFQYITEVKSVHPSASIIVKVGLYPNKELQEKCIRAMFLAGANAISGINSVKKNIRGFPRNPSGICGALIRNDAMQFVKDSRQIIDKLGINLTLIGVGGITSKKDAQDLLDAGADFVQCATGFLLNPYFMHEDLSM